MRTTYQPPEFKKLQESAGSLDKRYKGKDGRRLASIENIKAIVTECKTEASQNIVLGSLVEGWRETRGPYRFISPDTKTLGLVTTGGWADSLLKKAFGEKNLFTTGSTYNGLLKDTLELSLQNQMDKYHELLYLAALNAHYAETLPENDAKRKKSTADLEAAFTDCQYEIAELLANPLSADVIEKNLAEIPDKYASLKGERGIYLLSAKPKPEDHPKLKANELCLYLESGKLHYTVKDPKGKIQEREIAEGNDKDQLKKSDMAALKLLLGQNPLPTKLLYVNDISLTDDAKKAVTSLFDITTHRDHTSKGNIQREEFIAFLRTIDVKLKAYQGPENDVIRTAAIIYLMEILESEFTFQSDLYKICQEAINLKHTSHLSASARYAYYSALNAFIPAVVPHEKKPCDWFVTPIANANNFLSDMIDQLLEKMRTARMEMKNGPSHPLPEGVRSATNAVMSCGANVAIGSFTGGVIGLVAERRIATTLLATLANASYGRPGKMLVEQVGGAVEGIAYTTIFNKTVKAASSNLIKLPGNILYHVLRFPGYVYEGVSSMLPVATENKFYEDPEFINMLMTLPNKLLSQDMKKKLSQIQLYAPVSAPVSAPKEERLEAAASASLGR
jgi:hypothetical protein